MSSDIIHSLKIERDPRHAGVFVERTIYSSSNCWSHDGKSRPRNEDCRHFSDSENGNFAMFLRCLSGARAYHSGMSKGAGGSFKLSPLQNFKRQVNRANKAGMRVPCIADPIRFSWYSERDVENDCAPSFLWGDIGKSLRQTKLRAEGLDIDQIEVPEHFEDSRALGLWAKSNRLMRFSLKVQKGGNNPEILRFFRDRDDCDAYQFARRSRTRGYFFNGQGYQILKLVEVTRRS